MKTIVYIGNQLSGSGNTPTTIDVLVPEIESLGIRVVTASKKLNKILRLADMLTTIVKHRKADAVIIDTYSTSAFYFALACAQLCRLLHLKYIPVLHGGNLPQRFIKSPVLTRLLFGYSFTNIAVSLYLEEVLIKYGYRHRLIENSIRIANYTFTQRVQAAPAFIWVRAFDSIYNPGMAIQVFNHIHQHDSRATLVMVGPDKDGSMEKCKAMVNDMGLQAYVTFTGKLGKEEWRSIAGRQDIFINTSSFDNLPLSVIEAMALGLVIVSTDAGGLPFFLQHKENAVLSPVNDKEKMIANIEAILSGAIQAPLLSRNARATAEQYDWNIIKNKWIALFDGL